jgi:hypothetical protein
MARRTITIVSGEDLTGEQYADRFRPGSSGLTTAGFIPGRRARHDDRCPWR